MRKLIVAAVVCLLCLPAFTATYYWSDDVDGNWETQNNWWNDAGKTSQATSLPGNGDSVEWATGETTYALINSAVGLGAGTCSVDIWIGASGSVSSGTFAGYIDTDTGSDITGGTFTGTQYQQLAFQGDISGGTFSGDGLYLACAVADGTFSGSQMLYSPCIVSGGTWSGSSLVLDTNAIVNGGTYTVSTVSVYAGADISGGTWSSAITVGEYPGGTISGGTFTTSSTVTMDYSIPPDYNTITGGTFYCTVTFTGTENKVEGGTFHGQLDGVFTPYGGTSLGGSSGGETMMKWYPKSDIIGSGLF